MSYLCNGCGKRLDDSVKVCPDCGTKNMANPEVLEEAMKVAEEESKTVKKTYGGLLTGTMIAGIVILVLSIIIFAINVYAEGLIFMYINPFIGTVGGAFALVFSIIGKKRTEPVLWPVFAGIGVGGMALATGVIMLLTMVEFF